MAASGDVAAVSCRRRASQTTGVLLPTYNVYNSMGRERRRKPLISEARHIRVPCAQGEAYSPGSEGSIVTRGGAGGGGGGTFPCACRMNQRV